jgi:serine protease Do
VVIGMLKAIVALSLSFVSITSGLAQQQPDAKQQINAAIQDALVWTGHYDGLTDGDLGKRSAVAITDFQRANGLLPSGELDQTQVGLLFDRAGEERRKAQFKLVNDSRALVTLGLPMAYLTRSNETPRGTRYASPNGELSIIVGRFVRDEGVLKSVYQRVIQTSGVTNFHQRVLRKETFYVSGEDDDRFHYYTGKTHADEVRGLSITFSKQNAGVEFAGAMQRLTIAIVNSFHNPIPAYPSVRRDPEIAGFTKRLDPPATTGSVPPRLPRDEGSRLFTGSGFFVDATGHLITNYHVIQNCSELAVLDYGAARLVESDAANDLAIVKVTSDKPIRPVRFRPDEVDLGEKIVVMGYPLVGVLAASVNVTSGIVSSLRGVQGDQRYLQITAAVQNGNSGGPLLDEAGRLSGVVTAKLNLDRFDRGSVPENIAFAIRASYVTALLRAARITPQVEPSASPRSEREIAAAVGASTVLIVCRGRAAPAEAKTR